MIEISPLAMASIVAFVVLAGSLLGSSLIFLGGGPRDKTSSPGYQRPADWPTRSGGVAHYPAATAPAPQPGRTSLLALLFVGAVFYVVAAVGMSVYKSPWEPEVTLRHIAATLHCDLARMVDLVPARRGAPGYHARNDGDGNGIACETYAPTAGINALPVQQPVATLAPEAESLPITR